MLPGRISTRNLVFRVDGAPKEFDRLGVPGDEDTQTALGWRRKHGSIEDKVTLHWKER